MVLLTIPTEYKCWIQNRLAYRSFLIFENISKTGKVFKYHRQFFNVYQILKVSTKVLPSTKVQTNGNICSCLQVEAGFFVIQMGIISISKIWHHANFSLINQAR